MAAFRDFLEGQRAARNMNVPAFAEFLGISDTALRNFVHKTSPKMTSRDTLIKIAGKTGVSLETLVGYLDPEAAERIRRSSGRVEFYAQKIRELDDDQAELVFGLIEDMLRQKKRRE